MFSSVPSMSEIRVNGPLIFSSSNNLDNVKDLIFIRLPAANLLSASFEPEVVVWLKTTISSVYAIALLMSETVFLVETCSAIIFRTS